MTGVSIADELPGPHGRSPLAGDGAGTGRLGDRSSAARPVAPGAGHRPGHPGRRLPARGRPSRPWPNDNVNFLTSREWSVDGAQLRFGIAELLWTTVVTSTDRHADRGPGRRRRRAVHHPVRAALAAPARRQPGRPAGRRARRSSTASGACGRFGPAYQPVQDFLQSKLGWFPLFSDDQRSAAAARSCSSASCWRSWCCPSSRPCRARSSPRRR